MSVEAIFVSKQPRTAIQSSETASAGGDHKAAADAWDIERRDDQTLLVRVHSIDRHGRRLPDAVFTFRKGDPQYEHWERLAKQATSK
jgi:hypothetical protein